MSDFFFSKLNFRLFGYFFFYILYQFIIINDHLHFHHILDNLKFCPTLMAVGHYGVLQTFACALHVIFFCKLQASQTASTSKPLTKHLE